MLILNGTRFEKEIPCQNKTTLYLLFVQVYSVVSFGLQYKTIELPHINRTLIIIEWSQETNLTFQKNTPKYHWLKSTQIRRKLEFALPLRKIFQFQWLAWKIIESVSDYAAESKESIDSIPFVFKTTEENSLSEQLAQVRFKLSVPSYPILRVQVQNLKEMLKNTGNPQKVTSIITHITQHYVSHFTSYLVLWVFCDDASYFLPFHFIKRERHLVSQSSVTFPSKITTSTETESLLLSTHVVSFNELCVLLCLSRNKKQVDWAFLEAMMMTMMMMRMLWT